jgi:hypothetical protein
MNSSKTFVEQFSSKFSSLREVDFLRRGKILGVRRSNESLIFDFFNRQIKFSRDGIHDIEGQSLSDAVKTVLCQYLLMCPGSIGGTIGETLNQLVTLREFSDSGPLFSSFTDNTSKIIQTAFSGNLSGLKNRCLNLGGTIMENISFDLSVRFKALSRVPVVLNFNDRDDMMTASASYLFHDNADKYLDLECMAILCTYLTGQLIQQADSQ